MPERVLTPAHLYRPRVHYAPAINWMNDPNGLVYAAGQYQMSYQYNPYGDTHGHMHWGRATSPDLVHWTEQEIALWQGDHEIFSGSAFIDHANTSGFGKSGETVLVACYTGHTPYNQSQFLAYSLDGGEQWHPQPEAVLDVGRQDFRDPRVFWHSPSSQWIMAVVHPYEHQIELYGSPNLRDWQSLSLFGPAGATGGIWEVPELFPVEDEQGQTWWVLKVDLNPGGPFGGSGVQYWLGDFDGRCFDARTPARWVDHGKDFYAALTWSDLPEPSRRVWLAWMNNWQYAQAVPTPGQRGMMSLARELRVARWGEAFCLAQSPIPELQKLRGKEEEIRRPGFVVLNPACAAELKLTFTSTMSGALRLTFHSDEGPEGTVVLNSQMLRVIRPTTAPTTDLAGYAGEHSAELPPGPEVLDLHLFLDACSLEVFASEGRVVISDLLYPNAPIRKLEVDFEDADILQAQLWTLTPSGPTGRLA